MTDAAAPIEQLLIDLMRAPDSVAGERLAALDAANRDALVGLARRSRCAPYLAHVLDTRGDFALPDGLHALRERGMFRALAIGRECAHIHAMLADAGIDHVFLKGVALAFRDYAQPWMRPMRDIDILIEPGRLDDAYSLLHRAGGGIERFAHVPPEMQRDGKHLPPVHSPGRVVPVELHYRMLSPKLALPAAALAHLEAAVWQGRERVRIGEADVPVPRDEILLAHLLIHGMLDHELNNGPLFLADLVALLRARPPHRERWVALVERTGLQHMVALAASMLPGDAREALAVDAASVTVVDDATVRALMFQPERYRAQVKVMASLADDRIGSRVALAARKLFVSRAALTGQWRFEGHAPGTEPRSMIGFRLWYMATKLRQFFRRRSRSEDATLQSLRRFRAQLSAPPGDA
ncbi:nucleotidyltransferase family protein [Sphingomonas baiyangensis]|nr:nucleotidyltransferase family protein [Sphingomonas baiyangensis]